MKRTLLKQIVRDRQNKQPVALVTQLDGGAQWLVYPEGSDASAGSQGKKNDDATGLPALLIPEARRSLEADGCRRLDAEGCAYFIQSFNPPLRMLIVGAVHIAQFLAPMAELVGFEVIVVEPREAFAQEGRFPGIQLRRGWPGPVLAELELDARSAVVILSHDPKIDDPALAAALGSSAFYIGALGSTKNHRGRLERLAAMGFDASACARVHGPVGLPIGSRSPAEIAVSIVAQAIQARRGQPE
ncbi:MAG: XdhC family protein [Myxococcota bacterium]|jgi:xanthine dehydrogenase accessory factor|nr:XdhC family protein [Myxococcota bacterium]